MQAVLVMFRSDGERRSFSLTRDVTVIGRREDADLRIPLGDISRKHARLIREPDGMRLEDLGSSNGTFLNGQRIEREAMLQAGDSIQVGPVVFVLQMDGYPADEELNPITAESASAAAMFAGGAAAGAAGATLSDDDLGLEPLPAGDAGSAGDDLMGDDLMGGDALPGGGHDEGALGLEGQEGHGQDLGAEFDELQPIDELQPADELQPIEDDAGGGAGDAGAYPPPVYQPGTISLDDDESIPLGDAPPAPPAASAPIPIDMDDELAAPAAGEPLALADDEAFSLSDEQPPLALSDAPPELADDQGQAVPLGDDAPLGLADDAPLELADDAGGGSEPIPLGDDAALELLDEDPQSTPPHGDPLAIDLDEQPGQAKR